MAPEIEHPPGSHGEKRKMNPECPLLFPAIAPHRAGHHVLRNLTHLLLFLLLLAPGPALSARPPNIVLILTDDLGYGDLSCYNSRSKIATPHIDQLAAQGMRFTDAHSPATVCTPTRYGLLTGQMAFRVPNGGTVFTGAGGPSLIADERLTLPEMLRQQGYSTAIFGKWHLGLTFFDQQNRPINDNRIEAVSRIDYSRPITGGPLDHGFDSFFGTACCPTTDWLYAFIDGNRIPVPPTEKIDRSKLPKHPYSIDCRDGFIAPGFPMEEVDLVFLKKSIGFLETHHRETPDRPFFLFHSTQGVHLPSFAAPQFKGATQAGPHGDFIHQLDWTVGQLMGTLDKLGLADHTIVIFTSDNGPEATTVIEMRKSHEHDGARPWRGVKRDAWEGGHRVPFLVRWPEKIRSGTSDQLTSLTDLMATLASVTGATLPDHAAEDSYDMLPAWTGEASGRIRPHLLMQAFRGKATLSIRKDRWKYIGHQGSGGNNYEKRAELKPYQLADTDPGAPAQLYDLESDPGETRNLYSTHPEVSKQLNDLLEALVTSGRSAPAR